MSCGAAWGGQGRVQTDKVKVKLFSRFQLFATPWTVAHQAPPSMGYSRQDYWSGLSFPPPGYLPNPGIKLPSPALAGGFFKVSHQGSPYVILCCSSGAKSCLTLCNPMDCSLPGFPVLHCLPEFAQTLVPIFKS